MDQYSLFMSVLNRGKAESFLNEMRVLGLTGGVVLFGEGTATNRLLKILGLDETQKEIILLPPIEEKYDQAIHHMLLENFRMDKKNRGIAFSIPLAYLGNQALLEEGTSYDVKSFSHQCIFVVVDEGRGKDVVRETQNLGQFGGTIIHGRGAGIPSEAFFPFKIEPQKDLAMLVVKSDQVESIQSHLFNRLDLAKAGKGIMFTLPVSRFTGSFDA